MILDHKHLIIRAEVNDPPRDEEVVKAWIRVLVGQIGMKLVTKLPENPIAFYSDIPGNQGITAVAIIETSHIAIHVWDEVEPALIQLDVYSCADFEASDVVNHIQIFDPVRIQTKFIDRKNDLIDIPLD